MHNSIAFGSIIGVGRRDFDITTVVPYQDIVTFSNWCYANILSILFCTGNSANNNITIFSSVISRCIL